MDDAEVITQLRERCTALAGRVAELEAQLDGDAELFASRLQARAARQRQALDRLNRKVLTQRFRLRLLASLGRDVTRDEYLAARDGLPTADRIGDYEPLAV